MAPPDGRRRMRLVHECGGATCFAEATGRAGM